MCTGPLFPISSYSALFIPLKHSFLAKGYQSSNICIIFINILQTFFPILSTSLKIGIQITLCRKMWLLSRSALAQRSSSLLLRSASLSTPLGIRGEGGEGITQHIAHRRQEGRKSVSLSPSLDPSCGPPARMAVTRNPNPPFQDVVARRGRRRHQR